MSSIGKILTVLNLVLAAAFFGWAAHAVNSNQDWKVKHEKVSAEYAALKKVTGEEAASLAAAKMAADQQVQLLTGQIETAKNSADRLRSELNDSQKDVKEFKTSLSTISTTLQGIDADKTRLQKDKDQAETAQRDAETAKTAAESARDEADKARNDLRAELESAKNSIASLEKERTSLEKKRNALETDIETLAANTGAKVGDFLSMPEISGAVLDVSTAVEPGLVALNVGANKNVKRGFTFEIFDGKTYKGQARVEFVHGDMSSAIITRKVPGQTIRQGDSAMTRL